MDFPITKASLNLTRACNLACQYCFTNGCTKGDMTWAIAKRSVDFLFKNAMNCSGRDREVEISFWGGEPLLKWELLTQIVRYATYASKNSAIPVKFGGTTNGTLLTPEKFDFLKHCGLRFLVSFDGTPETHNIYRKFKNGEGSQTAVEENLKAAIAEFGDYRPRLSLLAERVDHFFEDMKYIFDLGVNNAVFSPVYEGDWTEEKWLIFEDQGKKIVDYMEELAAKGRKTSIQHFEGYCQVDNSQWPCGAGRFYVGIDIDGAIYPCHRFNKFPDERPWHEKELCIGHIDHGITRPEFRKQFIDWEHGCGDCERLKDTPCHGGCYAVRWDLIGSLKEPYKQMCRYVDAQKRVSAYYKFKFPVKESEASGRSCVCNNMCYEENTANEVKAIDETTNSCCVCNKTSYVGIETEPPRPLTPEEKRTIPPSDREILRKIFIDIDRRLTTIEKHLGMRK